MAHEHDSDRPPMRWRLIASFIVFGTGVGFLLLDALGKPLFGVEIDLDKQGTALILAALFFWFGFVLPDIWGKRG